jgi:hypothetical protein
MFLDSIIPLDDTPHATLRIISIVSTLLKTVPNTYILLSFAGMFLPASFQAAFLSLFSLAPLEAIFRRLPFRPVFNVLDRMNPVHLFKALKKIQLDLKHPRHMLKGGNAAPMV